MKTSLRTAFSVIVFAGWLSAIALAQGFPWEIFKSRTLTEVISITTKAVRPDDSMFLATNHLESKVRVTFTGQSRPISEGRKSFIEWWVGMLNHPKNYAGLYEREYLYKEGSEEHWLPTQAPVSKYFDKELKSGDEIDLYLISIGAYRTKDGIDCVVLVEEFLKPKSEPAMSDSKYKVGQVWSYKTL